MSYIHQHTQDRINGMVTFYFELNKYKMSSQLVGEIIERALDDKFIEFVDATGRQKYDRIIKKEVSNEV
tara:strand:+ start:369 stop:575 length:207 start_codon:yes stop_codon:yes gene_type:complete